MNPDQRMRDEALDWAARVLDPEFGDWDGFTAWLERDPDHARAYDEVRFAVEEAEELLAAPPEPAVPQQPVANDNVFSPFSIGRRGWIGTAIAASLALVAGFALWPPMGSDATYATQAGETLQIALEDGSTVELGGASRITISGDNERQARLESGQALFTIRHDEADPFVLMVGSERLVDAGTVFDVRMTGDGLDLAVAEGAVLVNPDALALRVDAGQRAVLADGRYASSPIASAEVGEWTRGRVTFREADLTEVAAELSRATGIAFAGDPSARDVRLSGSIALDRVREDPRVLEPVLGLSMRRDGERWIIAAE